MGTYLIALATILAVELTDKTRLIALLLSARYRAPVQLTVGMTLGYVPAIALAVLGAGLLTQVIPTKLMRWLVAAAFMGFGAWLLWNRETDENSPSTEKWLTKLERFSPFWIGLGLVAVTEFADKSQIATAGLMTRFRAAWPVFLGSLSAQAALNVVYVTIGQVVGRRLPVVMIQRITGIVFVLFGLLALVA